MRKILSGRLFEGEVWRNRFDIYVRLVLLFPVIVVFLVSVAFVIGGKCSVWQWWGGVAIVSMVALWCRRGCVVDALTAIGLFIITMMVFCIWSQCVAATFSAPDQISYHEVAVRLLANGWNPVYCTTPEAIEVNFSLPREFYNVWHVLAMPKSVWYFDAVGFLVSKNHWNASMYASTWVLWGVSLNMLSIIGKGCIRKMIGLGLLWGLSTSMEMSADLVLSLAGVGLVINAMSLLKDKRLEVCAVTALSFWMCTAKQIGALHCLVGWIIVTVAYAITVRRYRILRLLEIGGCIAALVIAASISPYWTMYRTYKHPLYPCFTSDKEKYPICDFVADFKKWQNADAAMMGRVGRFVNAFVSKEFAHWYYRMKNLIFVHVLLLGGILAGGTILRLRPKEVVHREITEFAGWLPFWYC